MKTHKAARVDHYVAALLRDPAAEPPPDLDAETARIVRAIMAAQRVKEPNAAVKQRVWQRARMRASRPIAASETSGPRPSSNGHNPELQLAFHTTIQQRQAAHPRWSLSLSLVAAVIAMVLFAGILMVMQRSATPTGPSKTVEETVFERYIRVAWNAGDTAELGELLATDVLLHTPGLGDVVGLEGMRASIDSFRARYPDTQFHIITSTTQDNRVAARLMVSVSQPETLNVPGALTLTPEDGQVSFTLDMAARFEDERIAELWIQSDGPGLWLLMRAFPDAATMDTKDLHLARFFALDILLDQGQYASPEVPTLVDPALVIHDTARDGTQHDYDFADLSSGALDRGPLFNEGKSVEQSVAKGDLVAVRVLVPEDTSVAPHWAEWITLYRFDEEGQIVEGWRFWHHTYVEVPTVSN